MSDARKVSALQQATLIRVRMALLGVYTEEGVEIWLHSHNRNLDGVPYDLLLAGDERVLGMAELVGNGW